MNDLHIFQNFSDSAWAPFSQDKTKGLGQLEVVRVRHFASESGAARVKTNWLFG